ncbi:zinc-binding alcohol dehydrogenase family protein [Rhodococcus koreensis]|uniref:quinone oxidoreductase family protein n=1 Tax=Rhodococcus koreensis TaxID=99653 RepID=UPI0036723E4C
MSAATGAMAALMVGHGPDWVRDEIPVPDPGPTQIRVRVRAAALNRADMYMLEGTYNSAALTTREFVAGRECAGVVDAVGAEVDGITIGDRVMGAASETFAEYALLEAANGIPVPPALSWIEAAALPVALGTEHDALVTQAGFTAGDSVLVLGGTSSIGLVGIQMAKALGSPVVVATTTSRDKAAALEAAGADVVVVLGDGDFVARVLDATEGRGVDIVLDHLAGEPLAQSIRATRIGGTIVNIGRLAGRTSTISLDDLSFRRIRLQGTTFSVRTAAQRAQVYAALRPAVLPAVADRRIRPVIDRVYAFDDALAAAERMRSNQAVGKLVLEMPTG